MSFAWEPAKAAENISQHRGVTFEEASTVFDDPFAVTMPDPERSEGEERYLKLGYATRPRLLVVSYTERQERTRIISARQATRTERRIYEEG